MISTYFFDRAQEIIEELDSYGDVNPRNVADYLSEITKVKRSDLIGRGKKDGLSSIRAIGFFYLRELGYSYPVIGDAFNKDHTTVIHGVKRINKYLEENGIEIKFAEGSKEFVEGGLKLEELLGVENISEEWAMTEGKSKKFPSYETTAEGINAIVSKTTHSYGVLVRIGEEVISKAVDIRLKDAYEKVKRKAEEYGERLKEERIEKDTEKVRKLLNRTQS